MSEDLEFKKSDFDFAGQERPAVDGIEIPQIFINLARALPMPVCPPEHALREAMTYCKACDESRDELQQMVGDGDLNAVAVVVGVYLRRLYEVYSRIQTQLVDLNRNLIQIGITGMAHDIKGQIEHMAFLSGELEEVFIETLSDEEREARR